MNEKVLHRGQILVDSIGHMLTREGFEHWLIDGSMRVKHGDVTTIEVMLPMTDKNVPIGRATRAAFDTFANHSESRWLGTSVWEPRQYGKPLLGTALMQESDTTWWSLHWVQQRQAPGLVMAKLRWFDDPEQIYTHLERFLHTLRNMKNGSEPASFLLHHMAELKQTARMKRFSQSNKPSAFA